MVNANSPLTMETTRPPLEMRSAGCPPIRQRIAERILSLGPNMPVRGKLPPRSVTPLY